MMRDKDKGMEKENRGGIKGHWEKGDRERRETNIE